jgi:hypothetical protein
MPPTSSRGDAQTPDRAWRLEAFDLRAGLAFATFREREQPPDEERVDAVADWPCLFFSAPDFEAQTIDNVALALAASRQSFASPLLVNGAEVGFAFPAEISEFLRRAYVASSGGDGVDGLGGPAVPPKPRRPNDPSEYDTYDLEDWKVDEANGFAGAGYFDYLYAVARYISTGAYVGDSASSSDIKRFKPFLRGAYEPMRRGAQHILIELLDRCPDAGDALALLRWDDDLRRLGAFMARCGLLESIANDGSPVLYGRVTRTIDQLFDGQVDNNNADLRIVLSFLLTAPERLRQVVPKVDEEPPPEYEAHWNWSSSELDPYDSLARWPAPGCTQDLGSVHAPGRCSVLALLSAVVSTPAALVVLKKTGRLVALDVAVFACACLTCREDLGPSPQSHPSLDDGPRTRAFAENRSDNALRWLDSQLPKRIFRVELEDLIHEARNITYCDVAPSTTSPPPSSALSAAG